MSAVSEVSFCVHLQTFTKGLSMLGETVANSFSGNKPYGSGGVVVSGSGSGRKGSGGSPDSPGCRPGVVTVVDVQSVVDPQVTAVYTCPVIIGRIT